MLEPNPTLALAEKVVELLDRGGFTATYKYAVLLALLDLCVEHGPKPGHSPRTGELPSFTTRQFAEKVFELYWRQVGPYSATGGQSLRQSRGRPGQVASILAEVQGFWSESQGGSLHSARRKRPDGFERAVGEVEWTLIRHPLPRLQRIGDHSVDFLYTLAWDEKVHRGPVRRYQKGKPSDFDNLVRLQAGVCEALISLNGVLRPLIHREWARLVARVNALPDADLEQFLFGVDRRALTPVKGPLLEMQKGKCFYCEQDIRSRPHVDHFIPWTRHPDNGIHNLVVAHGACNVSKRDFLAAPEHLEKWWKRVHDEHEAHELSEVGLALGWPRDADRTLNVATTLYDQLPTGAMLWLERKQFVSADPERIGRVLWS